MLEFPGAGVNLRRSAVLGPVCHLRSVPLSSHARPDWLLLSETHLEQHAHLHSLSLLARLAAAQHRPALDHLCLDGSSET